MTPQQEPARENLREFIDKLVEQGYTVRDGQSPDPDLIDPGGSAVETWREGSGDCPSRTVYPWSTSLSMNSRRFSRAGSCWAVITSSWWPDIANGVFTDPPPILVVHINHGWTGPTMCRASVYPVSRATPSARY